jgi:hypothetical protein
MTQHIRIGMTRQPQIIRDGDTPKNQRASFYQFVNIVSYANPHSVSLFITGTVVNRLTVSRRKINLGRMPARYQAGGSVLTHQFCCQITYHAVYTSPDELSIFPPGIPKRVWLPD